MGFALASIKLKKPKLFILLSVRLFALLGAQNAHNTKNYGKNAFGLAQNATFWKKLRFGLRQKTRSKRAKFMDRKRSINQNAHARFPLLPLGWWFITKMPIKINQFSSHAWSLTPLISSLCSPFAWSSFHASHLFSLLCPLCGKSLCSVIRLSFFLFFFLSSSSSTRTDLVFVFFLKILFLSNLIWEIRFEGRDLIN